MEQFFRLFDLFFVASKRLISFFTICDRISSCSGIVLWSSLSRITWIMCFEFKWLIKLSVFEPPTFVSRSTNCALLFVERCMALRFHFLWLLTSLNWMRMIKNRPIILFWRKAKYFVENYCKLKRNKSILQRITACVWTNMEQLINELTSN